MKSIATLVTAAALFSATIASVAAANDEHLDFGSNTVSGTIGGLPATGYGQDDRTLLTYLTF